MFNGTLTYAQAGSNAVSIIGALLTAGSGLPHHQQGARLDRASPAPRVRASPPTSQGSHSFLGAPIFVDVTGDGLAEIRRRRRL
jgi:hypothetical protein